MSKRLRVIVEADGGARGNPGPAGYGAVVREAGTGEILTERAAAIGAATNNVAEYSGLLAGLTAAADLGAVEVEVRMDSKLVVEQMAGRWQIRHPGLRPLAAQAAVLAGRFDEVRYTWIPREQNRRADALANAAMDGRAEAALAAPPPEDAALPSQRAAPAAPQPMWVPPSIVNSTRLVLVRHGATLLTVDRRFSGRDDVKLSSAGLAQAEAVAARLVTLVGPERAVVSSPLSRCVRTAERIALRLKVPVHTDPDLIECDYGRWEGLTYAEVRERFPDELAAWLKSSAVAPPGGESFDSVADRARRVSARLMAAHPRKTVVVVSHVTPIKCLLREALAATDLFMHRLFLDPTGISIVDVSPEGAISVRTVNDTAHL